MLKTLEMSMDFERLIVRVCMYSRKNIVLNLKIPAWAVLKFWGFASLSVLRQSVLRDPTLLYDRRRHRNCFPTRPAQAFPKK